MIRLWSKLPLSIQIAVFSATLLSVTVSITVAINISHRQQDIKDNLLERGLALGHSLSAPLSYYLIRNDYDAIEASLLNSAQFPGLASLKLVDTKGNVLGNILKLPGEEVHISYSQEKDKGPPEIENSQTPVWLERPSLLEIWYPLKTSTLVGWLNINLAYTTMDYIRKKIIRDNIITAASVILIHVLLLQFVLHKPTRRIHHAIAVAQKLNTTNPPQTNVSGGSRELSMLFAALNGAAARLSAQHKEIEIQTNQLKNMNRRADLRAKQLLEQSYELEQSRSTAHSANQAKSKFLSSMSHELRTPLNAILGFTQLLQLDATDERTKRNTSEMLKAGKYLLELINQVLDLATIESGIIHLTLSPHEINDLLADSLSTIKPMADNLSIKIDNKVDPALSTKVNVDKSRFKQVLLNLLSNAIKYNSKNGTITIECWPSDSNMLCLSISDEGQGLSPEQQAHLFKPFDRAGAENSNIQGTGLGLVITKDLIEQMNGTIAYESTVNKGSRFWIEIPIAYSSSLDPSASSATVPNNSKA